MKSYTDIEQSKKLAEILPIESADMCYIKHSSSDNPTWEFNEDFPPMILGNVPINEITAETLPCWSLVALFDALPDESDIVKGKVDVVDDKYMCTVGIKEELVTAFGNNPIDACYNLILKLHELNLL